MRIRWKFLIVLLSISLIPIIGMRLNAQKAMRELGNDLASQSKSVLVQETKVALKRLVEDHARVLKRERELLEMMLLMLSSEIEKHFSDSRHVTVSAIVSKFPAQERPVNAHYSHDMYCAPKPSGTCRPLRINFLKQGILIDSKFGMEPEAADAANLLISMTPLYHALKKKYPELILWQYVVLENGLHTIYPEPGPVPERHMRQSAMIPDWYHLVKEKKQMTWSQPALDSFTRNIAFFIAAPLHDSNGQFMGATAIAVPLTVFLHENQHIRMLSDHVTSLLVKAEDSPEYPVSIIAQEFTRTQQHMHWFAADVPVLLESPDTQQLQKMAEDLRNHRSEVREMLYDGNASLAAYQSFDQYGTALLLIVPKADILEHAMLMEQYVHDRIDRQIVFTGLILISIIALIIALSFVLSRSFTANISKLAEAVARVGAGDFQARVRLKSRDELGELGRTFNKMIPALEERVHMKQALDLVVEIQQSLFPSGIPHISGMDIAAKSLYCQETGGDFYDFMAVRRGSTTRTAFAVGDVTGHGLSAALLMATSRAFLRARLTQPGTMAEMISDVNRLLAEDTYETSQFVTLFYLEVDHVQKSLHWVRAGHDPAFLYDPKSNGFFQLEGSGPALGVIGDFEFPETEELNYAPGQIILIGTDGIWETRNPEGKMLGKERVKNIIKETALQSAGHILDAVVHEVEDFRQDRAQDDDITLVVLKVVERPETSDKVSLL
ncbi:MAG: SpoIIE family protein phosphatase [Desulfobacterales bacterium]